VLVPVKVSGGKVIPPTHRVNVPIGHRVRLRVDSDVADEVHVHGYDLKQNVAPGSPATVEFVADQPGLFEVELEAAKLQLVQLEVH
jgi:heme/copper-type cytochrome/quinol oxidase subunit 2